MILWSEGDLEIPHSKLKPTETELIGEWIYVAGKISSDDACDRIKWLTSKILKQIAFSKEFGAWETLFRDPADQRCWERTYPQGHLHGGGPPALFNISNDNAAKKYLLNTDG